MSKSSKARKRIIKMIRAEASIMGETNILYDECKADFKKYCDNRIKYYDGIYTNKEILKYYKEVLLPELKAPSQYAVLFQQLGGLLKQANVEPDVISNAISTINSKEK